MRGELDARSTEGRRSNTPDRIARDLENTLRAILKDMVCGYLDADVKRTADELLRGEAEARPEPEPDPEVGSPRGLRRQAARPRPAAQGRARARQLGGGRSARAGAAQPRRPESSRRRARVRVDEAAAGASASAEGQRPAATRRRRRAGDRRRRSRSAAFGEVTHRGRRRGLGLRRRPGGLLGRRLGRQACAPGSPAAPRREENR